MDCIPLLKLDHLGIRVTDLNTALEFYAVFGFSIDPSENLHAYQTCALHHQCGLRINLVYNADNQPGQNVLLDTETKHSGITHLAFAVKSIEETQAKLIEQGITITEGPLQVSNRRIICFVRDPDGNVIEFDQLL